MTASDVVLDTSAWVEVLRGSEAGRRIRSRFLQKERVTAHSSVLAMAETAAKITSSGTRDDVAKALASIRTHSRIHPVDERVAEEGGRLRADLRRRDPDASLIDALQLATARALGAKLVTNDRALVGEPDVIGF